MFTLRRLAIGLAWLASLAAASAATSFFYRHRAGILGRLGLTPTQGVLQTNLYDIRFRKTPIPTDGRYGAIAPLADGILYASRSGAMTYFDTARIAHPLALHVPIDVAAFESDPANAGVVDRDHFAVKDLFVQSTASGVRVVASYNVWDATNDCYGLRVSAVELPLATALAARGSGSAGEWRRLFDTAPCVPLAPLPNGRRRPTLGAGGRLDALSDRELLLTVGAFGAEDATSDDTGASASGAASSFSKTIAIDLGTGTSRVFTTGHRNPQGLVVASDGRIWSTEHAAKGGDELNLLREGADYGYPHVSYGTQYGMFVWPPSAEAPGKHEGYEKPMYAWVPSIGVSQLTEVRGDAFRNWRGDLIVSSLVGRSLYRLRVEEGRVIIAEPIAIGERLRDIVEDAAGNLVLLVDDLYLIDLTPLIAGASDQSLAPAERGQVVAGRCQGCHTFDTGGANGLGPNLSGILGRRIASVPGFTYTAGLRAVTGDWTEASLRAYLEDPAAFAPGTTMALPSTLTAQELDDLITYLRTLR